MDKGTEYKPLKAFGKTGAGKGFNILSQPIVNELKRKIEENNRGKMSRRLEYLLEEETTVVFDIDGVLAAFEFGELKHNGCKDDEWEQYVIENRPYDEARAIPQIKQFIKDKGIQEVYVCSVAAPFEEENKKEFVMREYGIPAEHIVFVRDKKEKINFLYELAKDKEEIRVALVEDTTSTLNQLYNASDFCTVHVSSFFFYGEN